MGYGGQKRVVFAGRPIRQFEVVLLEHFELVEPVGQGAGRAFPPPIREMRGTAPLEICNMAAKGKVSGTLERRVVLTVKREASSR